MTVAAEPALRTVIFAKAPVAGSVKTRLIPALGPQRAAELAAIMLRHTVAQALRAGTGAVELCVSPPPADPVWQRLALPAGLQWSAQGAGDLGARMARASARVCGQGQTLLLIGSDCPQLDAGQLQRAARALREHDACLLPVRDGGYALLGLNRHLPALFRDVPWSTAHVAGLTTERIRAAGYSLHTLATLRDIDEPADLAGLPREWRCAIGLPGGSAIAATAGPETESATGSSS